MHKIKLFKEAEELFKALSITMSELNIGYAFNHGYCCILNHDPEISKSETASMSKNFVKVLLKNEIKRSDKPILIWFREKFTPSQQQKYIELFLKVLPEVAKDQYIEKTHPEAYSFAKNVGDLNSFYLD